MLLMRLLLMLRSLKKETKMSIKDSISYYITGSRQNIYELLNFTTTRIVSQLYWNFKINRHNTFSSFNTVHYYL